MTAAQICVPSQLPGRQELLRLQLVKCFFHHSWSTSSIAAGKILLPLQLVKYFFHCSWSNTSSIAACQILLQLQVVKYFFRHSGSTVSSIIAGQVFFTIICGVVKYFLVHCSWSSASYNTIGQLLLLSYLVMYLFQSIWSCQVLPFIAVGQLLIPSQLAM